eukprot:c9376_g1_i4.p1 GENE.c9376_g1_i4~~c9376_g1_i4.p1  ORF type:complete len:290 (-),score=52.54 c9376_g1_i4:1011-1880(-)
MDMLNLELVYFGFETDYLYMRPPHRKLVFSLYRTLISSNAIRGDDVAIARTGIHNALLTPPVSELAVDVPPLQNGYLSVMMSSNTISVTWENARPLLPQGCAWSLLLNKSWFYTGPNTNVVIPNCAPGSHLLILRVVDAHTKQDVTESLRTELLGEITVIVLPPEPCEEIILNAPPSPPLMSSRLSTSALLNSPHIDYAKARSFVTPRSFITPRSPHQDPASIANSSRRTLPNISLSSAVFGRFAVESIDHKRKRVDELRKSRLEKEQTDLLSDTSTEYTPANPNLYVE